MIYANAVSGVYQNVPHFNFLRVELEPIITAQKSWTDAISASASWMTFGLNTQFYASEFELEPLIESFKSWIDASFIRYPLAGLPYWSSSAMRLEEAKAARNLLEDFGDLKLNWDGYGGSPISEEARGYARRFIDLIEAAPGLLPIPEISPTPSGTISLEWETHSAHAYLEIGAMRYSGFVKTEQHPLLLQGNADSLDQNVVSVIEAAVAAPATVSPTITDIRKQAPQYERLAA